jgi:hypothetical protein
MANNKIPMHDVILWAGADEEKWRRLVGCHFQHFKLGLLTLTSTFGLPTLKMDYAPDHLSEPIPQDLRISSDRLRFKISTLGKFKFAILNEGLREEFDADALTATKNPHEVERICGETERLLLRNRAHERELVELREEEERRVEEESRQAERERVLNFCDKYEIPANDVNKLIATNQNRTHEIVSHLIHKRLVPRTELNWARENGAKTLIKRYLNECLYASNDDDSNVRPQRNEVNYNVRWNIRFIHDYEPVRGRSEVPQTTSQIIDFKDNVKNLVQHYAEILDTIIGSNVIVCCAPSHSIDGWGDSLLETTRYLGGRKGRTALPNLLRRHQFTRKRTRPGSNRSLQTNLNSIEVTDASSIADRPVVVIDDVTTSGNTLLACSELLWEAGCNCVGAIALGQTISGFTPTANSAPGDLDDEIPF